MTTQQRVAAIAAFLGIAGLGYVAFDDPTAHPLALTATRVQVSSEAATAGNHAIVELIRDAIESQYTNGDCVLNPDAGEPLVVGTCEGFPYTQYATRAGNPTWTTTEHYHSITCETVEDVVGPDGGVIDAGPQPCYTIFRPFNEDQTSLGWEATTRSFFASLLAGVPVPDAGTGVDPVTKCLDPVTYALEDGGSLTFALCE